MNCHVTSPSHPVRLSVPLPASKSISNRVLILNALSGNKYPVLNLADCDDTAVLQQALTSAACNFDIKAAGTAMRFLTAYLSITEGNWTITGTERMKNRPIRILADALNALGAHIEYMEKEGYPPLRISGRPLRGGEIALAGNVSSQYLSALLMIAPLTDAGLTLRPQGTLISKPYIDLTLQLMEQFGVKADRQEQSICIPPQKYTPVPFTVESDWSAASYWYEIAALSKGSEIELTGLFKHSLQGDAAVARLFTRLGVETIFTDAGTLLRHTGNTCQTFEYDFINEPDLAQTLAATCAALNIPFRLTGLQSLKIKETDRMEALKTELCKLGFPLSDSNGDTLQWDGEHCSQEACPLIATYEDHRMAMSFAPFALSRPEGIAIADPEVVTKSYPAYWEALRSAGFTLTTA
ncbi:3-phosphoshikimate 1-carboxyvinyltransferase [Bacteroidales bacterium Barb7]|nr:3-phosphoshikimate 1-carboxyvinyltransferase [Bacteroidales bacterium Barb7]